MITARSTGLVVTIGGVLGLVAALTLTIEKFKLLEDSSYVPSCSINPVLSCGSIMKTEQAQVFGFPNPLIGIVAFAVVVLGGVLTLGRTPLPRWFWIGLSIGTAVGEVFVHWLIFQSLYRIGALCPYCMVVWVVTLPIFVVSVVQAVRMGSTTPGFAVSFLIEWRWTLAALWYAVVVALIGIRFADYWSTLI